LAAANQFIDSAFDLFLVNLFANTLMNIAYGRPRVSLQVFKYQRKQTMGLNSIQSGCASELKATHQSGIDKIACRFSTTRTPHNLPS
jgi:hypothetical protein